MIPDCRKIEINLALSVTPEYLVKIGLLQSAPDVSKDLGLLMQRALSRKT